MSTDRETTRIVRSWLEDGVTQLPDSVLDAVLDDLPATRQRRATWWPARRFSLMNNSAKVAMTAAVVLVVAFLGFNFLRSFNTGNPGIDDASPTPTPEPQTLVEGAVGPGTFSTVPTGENLVGDPPHFTFDMPAGWVAVRNFLITSTDSESSSGTLLFVQPSGLYSDPCLANRGDPDISVGSTAAEMASALEAHSAYDATTTGDVVIDGHHAVRMELRFRLDLDYAACTNGQVWIWDGPLYVGEPHQWTLWIIDVDGATAVLLADVSDAAAVHEDQIDEIVQSIQINP